MEYSESNYYIIVESPDQYMECFEIILPYCDEEIQTKEEEIEHANSEELQEYLRILEYPAVIYKCPFIGLETEPLSEHPDIPGTQLFLNTYNYQDGTFTI